MPWNAFAMSFKMSAAWVLSAANTVTSSAYAKTVTFSLGSAGLMTTPHFCLAHLSMRGLRTWPRSAENIAGDIGSPCRIPDLIETALVTLPCLQLHFVSFIHPLNKRRCFWRDWGYDNFCETLYCFPMYLIESFRHIDLNDYHFRAARGGCVYDCFQYVKE